MVETKKHRKVGRPKKRGPKKKRKSRAKPKPKIYKPKIQWNWKIVSVSNGKQKEYFGKFLNLEDAYTAFNILKAKNDEISFPRKLKNSHEMQESRDEYLLLEKNRFGDKENNKLRNEYGVLVENISTNKNWIILDKCPWLIEETFWIYGYDPHTDRKTFKWIYDNIVNIPLSDDESSRSIVIYKNKLVFSEDGTIKNMIICKNVSDTIRLYNAIQEKVEKDKLPRIYFWGKNDILGPRRKQLEAKLMDLTGWDIKKLSRKTTRP